MIQKFAYFYNAPADPAALTEILKRCKLVIFGYGDVTEAQAAKNAGATVLQYVRSDAIQDAGDKQPKHNQVAFHKGDFARIKKNHPDWFLYDASGRMILANPQLAPDYYLMDRANPGFNQFYCDGVKELRSSGLWDGSFFDNCELSLGKRQQFPWTEPVKYKTDAGYLAATLSGLQYSRANLPGLIYGNMVARRGTAGWNAAGDIIDGNFDESWGVDWHTDYVPPPQWAEDQTLWSPGKSTLFVSQSDNQTDLKRWQFAYASYLLIAHGNEYFRYASADAKIGGGYSQFWDSPFYDLDLGDPMVSPYPDENGFIYRIFSKGWVAVNPATHESTIVFDGSSSKF